MSGLDENKKVWLVYDGECPICKPAANALKIKRAVGELKLVDKRTSYEPIIDELRERGISLENGMVIKMNGNFYQGAEALHITALIGTGSDWLNRLNVIIFRSKTLTRLLYPLLKLTRRIGLRLKGVVRIID